MFDVEEDKWDKLVKVFAKDTCKYIYTKLKTLIEKKEIKPDEVFDFIEAVNEQIEMILDDYLSKLYTMEVEAEEKEEEEVEEEEES